MRPKTREYIENALCIAFIAMFALFAVWPTLLQNKVPSSAGMALGYPPWEEARSNGALTENLDASVQAHRFFPWYAYLTDAHHFRDLLWSPLEGCGMPFMALWRTRCFSPFSVPFYLFTPETALRLSLILKLLVAGWSAYYVARKYGFQPPLALLSGVAFELSGHIVLYSGWPISDVVPWLPLAIMYTERLAIGQTQYWALAAVPIALMAFGGDPESFVAALLFLSLYLSLRLSLNLRNARLAFVTSATFIVSVVVGVCVAGIQIAPFIEFLRESVNSGRIDTNTTLTLKHFTTSFLPEFFGRSLGTSTAGEVISQVQVLKLLYVGVVSLWMIPLWFAVRRFVPLLQKQRIEGMLISALIMTVLAFGLGHIGHESRLGQLAHFFSVEHLLIANALVLAFMIGAAAEEWLALNAEECGATILHLLIYIPLLAIGGGICWWAGSGVKPADTWPMWLQISVSFAFFVAMLVILGVTLLKPSVRILGYSLTVLVAISLLLAFHPAFVFVDASALFPQTSFIKILQENKERLSGSVAVSKWPLAANLIPQVYNPSGVMLKRNAAFLEQAKTDPFLLRRAGAPYLLLGKEDIQGAFASIRPVLAIKHVFPSGAVLFRDMGSKPRAWVTYSGRAVQTFDPAALSSTQPPLIEDIAFSNGPELPEARVTLQPSSSPAQVDIEVEGTHPGILVLTDTFYPGWVATVNEEPAQIFPVDGVFRGVQVKEGKYKVSFRYEPVSLKIGLCISLTALMLLGIQAFLCGYRFYRNRTSKA